MDKRSNPIGQLPGLFESIGPGGRKPSVEIAELAPEPLNGRAGCPGRVVAGPLEPPSPNGDMLLCSLTVFSGALRKAHATRPPRTLVTAPGILNATPRRQRAEIDRSGPNEPASALPQCGRTRSNRKGNDQRLSSAQARTCHVVLIDGMAFAHPFDSTGSGDPAQIRLAGGPLDACPHPVSRFFPPPTPAGT